MHLKYPQNRERKEASLQEMGYLKANGTNRTHKPHLALVNPVVLLIGIILMHLSTYVQV